MANDLTHNPLILDTAAVVSATNRFVILKIQLKGALAGDTAIFKNGAGQEIARLAAPAANATDELDFTARPLHVTGLELASIAASGIAHVYCG